MVHFIYYVLSFLVLSKCAVYMTKYSSIYKNGSATNISCDVVNGAAPLTAVTADICAAIISLFNDGMNYSRTYTYVLE